jgi:hypothetical protein
MLLNPPAVRVQKFSGDSPDFSVAESLSIRVIPEGKP